MLEPFESLKDWPVSSLVYVGDLFAQYTVVCTAILVTSGRSAAFRPGRRLDFGRYGNVLPLPCVVSPSSCCMPFDPTFCSALEKSL